MSLKRLATTDFRQKLALSVVESVFRANTNSKNCHRRLFKSSIVKIKVAVPPVFGNSFQNLKEMLETKETLK